MTARRTTSLLVALVLLLVGLPGLLSPAGSAQPPDPAERAITKPSAPRSVTTQAGPGIREVTVKWRPPASNGGARITSYVLKYAASETGPFALYNAYGPGVRTATMSGLPDGGTVWVRVFAKNKKGTGPGSKAISGTVPLVPGQVTGLAYTPGDGSVNLTWDVASDGGAPLEKYIVFQYTVGGWDPIADPVATNHTVTGLNADNEYQFKVRARNFVGDGPDSTILTARSGGGPGAPSITSASLVNGKMNLAWSLSNNGGAPVTQWTIERNVSGTWAPVSGVAYSGNSGEATIGGTTHNQDNSFRVKATTSEGTGPPSTPVTIKAGVGPPTPVLDVLNTAANFIHLEWHAPANPVPAVERTGLTITKIGGSCGLTPSLDCWDWSAFPENDTWTWSTSSGVVPNATYRLTIEFCGVSGTQIPTPAEPPEACSRLVLNNVATPPA